MTDLILVCPGFVQSNQDGTASCTEAWTTVDRPSVLFSPEDVDPEVLAFMFAAGFTLYASIWLASRGIRFVLSMIR